MRRGTYSDYITDEESQDCGSMAAVSKLYGDRVDALLARSGAHVSSGIVRVSYDPRHMVRDMRVSFDSRAWTGLR